jgi:hypothetical protein
MSDFDALEWPTMGHGIATCTTEIGKKLNVRATFPDGDILGQLGRGQQVIVWARLASNWMLVQADSGLTGWASGESLRVEGELVRNAHRMEGGRDVGWEQEMYGNAQVITAGNVVQRISPWMPLRDDKRGLNVGVIKWNERADAHLWPVEKNPTVYVLADLWSTHDGQWNVPENVRWAPPAWARTYIENPPWGAPGYFDDAGGDHNVFIAVRGLDGKLKTNHTCVFGSKGTTLEAFTTPSAWETRATKASGWANLPVWNIYYPDQGQVGAWAWWAFGASDVIFGGGMPYNNHVSVFAVLQEIPRPVIEPEPGEPSEWQAAALAVLGEIRDDQRRLIAHLGGA